RVCFSDSMSSRSFDSFGNFWTTHCFRRPILTVLVVVSDCKVMTRSPRRLNHLTQETMLDGSRSTVPWVQSSYSEASEPLKSTSSLYRMKTRSPVLRDLKPLPR